MPALHPLLGPYLHYLPLCLLLSIPSTVGSQPRLGALWGQALNKCEVLLPLPLLSGLHLPLWLTQGSGSLLKQEQRWPRYHPHQDPDPSAQTVRAESDSFIRFLKGRAGHTGGKDRTPWWPGWNKLSTSETSQSWERGPTGPGGSEGRADKLKGVEDFGKLLSPAPPASPPHCVEVGEGRLSRC